MSGYEVATIILGMVTLLVGISWVSIISRSKSLVKNLRELRDKYLQATANGVIDDTERVAITQEAIEMMEDAISLWQNLVNIVSQLRKIILRR